MGEVRVPEALAIREQVKAACQLVRRAENVVDGCSARGEQRAGT